MASEEYCAAAARNRAGHDRAAGGLDQGNIILNMMDVERRGLTGGVLFLAGSAINSIKNAAGKTDPHLGAEAMMQPSRCIVQANYAMPGGRALAALIAWPNARPQALREALRQRYP